MCSVTSSFALSRHTPSDGNSFLAYRTDSPVTSTESRVDVDRVRAGRTPPAAVGLDLHAAHIVDEERVIGDHVRGDEDVIGGPPDLDGAADGKGLLGRRHRRVDRFVLPRARFAGRDERTHRQRSSDRSARLDLGFEHCRSSTGSALPRAHRRGYVGRTDADGPARRATMCSRSRHPKRARGALRLPGPRQRGLSIGSPSRNHGFVVGVKLSWAPDTLDRSARESREGPAAQPRIGRRRAIEMDIARPCKRGSSGAAARRTGSPNLERDHAEVECVGAGVCLVRSGAQDPSGEGVFEPNRAARWGTGTSRSRRSPSRRPRSSPTPWRQTRRSRTGRRRSPGPRSRRGGCAHTGRS